MSLLQRHRVAVALFVASAVFLVGGTLILRALANPETTVFPADGHIALDYISGNRAYVVFHTKPGNPVCALTFRADGSPVSPAASYREGEAVYGDVRMLARFDLVKEGAYDFQITGLAAGDTATLVRETAFIWAVPAMLSGALAFVCFVAGLFAVFVVKKRGGDAASLA